jgi:hypothetical protein
MTNYEELIARINARSNPESLILEKSFQNELLGIQYGNVEKYIRLAMYGVDPAYTSKIREAGERVKEHLRDVLEKVTYKYQGSVETNTHIVATSDIDLLVITTKFWTPDHKEIRSILSNSLNKSKFSQSNLTLLESAVSPPFYPGNSKEVLKNNRLKSERKLLTIYDNCNITKPKAIQIENKSLRKEVDVVIANWFDNAESITRGRDVTFRGVQIYNKKTHECEDPDYPFLKIALLNERSKMSNGRLKKMIRFLKNIKAELNEGQKEPVIDKHKSFQFNAICYAIPLNEYKNKNIFQLVAVVYAQLRSLYLNPELRNSLMSVDDSEYIYKNKPDATDELKLLMDAIEPILIDLHNQKVVL